MSEQFNLNNRYQFMGMIGKGRFGDVYRAADNFFMREVALKMLHKDSLTPEFSGYFSTRYAQQAAMIGKLNNPSVIRTYDFTSLNGTPAWTMDLYSGVNFSQYAGTKLPVEQAAALLIPVADALTYTHSYGVFHGNLKPSNILIGNNQTPVLTDFGLTQWLSENGHGYGQFEASLGIGSPEYLAPEQAQGGMMDGRTDVYSLAIIFYELITGRRPFSAMSPLETMSHQVSDQLPSPRYFVPNISQQAEQFLYQATAKNPAQRISSMSEAAMMLRSLSTPGTTGTYYPPASYYNNSAPNEDEDDDDESISERIKAGLGPEKSKKLVLAGIFLAVLIIAAVIILIVSGNNRKLRAQNATATQIAFDTTQTAFIVQLEEQHQQTVQAEQVFQAQTQSALDLAATAAAEAAAVPTAEPVLIPTIPQVEVPTAASLVTGRFQTQAPADGTSFIMGEAFTTTWTIENTSSMNWGEDFKLVFDGGTNFSTGAVTERYTNTIIYPNGAAGLSIPCTAPMAEGTYTMQWHVEDNNGNVVFPNLTITIKSVYGVLTPTPAPTDELNAGPVDTPSIYIPPEQP